MRRHLLASVLMLLGATIVLGFGYPLVVTGISLVFFRHQADGSLVYRDGKLTGSSLLGQGFTDSKGNPLPGYFQPRPSAAGSGYDASSSGVSNLGPSNPLLIGFVPGVNTVGLNGRPSSVNPFATRADPACVPTDPEGNPVTSPVPGQKYARNRDGSYVCDASTVPERAIAYRAFNGLPASAGVPIDAVTASGWDSTPISRSRTPSIRRRGSPGPGISPQLRSSNLVHQYTQGREWGFLGEATVERPRPQPRAGRAE